MNITRKVEYDNLIWDVLRVNVENNELVLGRYEEVCDYYELKEKTVNLDKDAVFNV